MYRKYYQLFLEANKGTQHYAAHSHHYWPDITRQATLDYWDDSAKMVDGKWDYFFSNRIPETQKLIADVLKLSHPEQIVFAPNTHEFVCRILSCFHPSKKIRILTTDSEFYSFERQAMRLEEEQLIEIERVSTQPFESFEQRFCEKINSSNYDLIFFSQVFFNSGHVVRDLQKIITTVKNAETMIVVDGYHSFMAIPIDLSQIENRIFYLSGSYKYAQGGEGCCFMSVPSGSSQCPRNTGWFAGFTELSNKSSKIVYSDSGLRFAGATMDYTALYRLNSVLRLFENDALTVEKIHSHIQLLQNNFVTSLDDLNHPQLHVSNLINNELNQCGHFFTFDLQTFEKAKALHKTLLDCRINTDFRGSRLRFGFGLYQDLNIDWSGLK